MRRSHLGQTSNDASREDMLRFLALGVAGAHVIADVLGSRERAWRLRDGAVDDEIEAALKAPFLEPEPLID